MRLLSPRDLADALGVSESSLKRWVDAGKIAATLTAGGHRKISVGEALRFVRESGAPLARPELLGVPEVARATVDEEASPGNRLLGYLLTGDTVGARGWLLARYLGGTTIAALADGPIRDAMHALGELWKHDHEGVFVEHRGTDAALQAIAHLRMLVEPPPELSARPDSRPVAVGGTPEDDPYVIPSFLAASVLTEIGMRAVNLGPDTPAIALGAAVAHHRPRLVWISASTKLSADRVVRFAAGIAALPATVTVAIGGRTSGAILDALRAKRGKRPRIVPCASMADLAEVGRATITS